MIQKLDFQSPDFTNEHIEKIATLFPNCVTEVQDESGNLKRAIDFDLLKQELSSNIVDGTKERYRLEWPGKRAALVAANTPISKTLRPVKEESVNFDTTKNLYIEGDNLEALKLLQEAYLGAVKMIYIDPPYNTGKDFVYRDNFAKSRKEELQESGQIDEEGGRLVANLESNGRFHSDWLSMMYPRLRLARNLLKDDGVIFISIDDNEVHNLRKICDEIFGEGNFVAELVWSLSSGPQAGHFTRAHEYILVYTKHKSLLKYFIDNSGGVIKHGALKKISTANPASEITFKAGTIGIDNKQNIEFPNELGNSEKQYITEGKLKFRNGVLANDVTIKAGWAMREQLLSWLSGKETYDSKGQKVLRFYFNPHGILFYEKERGTIHPKTVLQSTEVGSTKTGSDELKSLFGQKILDFPKPTKLIKFLSSLATQKDDIILDFFSGSATTAHAVMQLNAEDGGNRRFILVQLPEPTDEKSEAYKAGYKTIAEIGKERIRRAGKKIKEENKDKEGIENLDIGFRVLKVDSSNFKDIYFSPDSISKESLFDTVEHIKEDRTPLDLLFGVLVDWGVDLSLPIEQKEIMGKSIYIVGYNDLIACFEEEIDVEFIKELAKEEALRVVFKESSFKDDATKINTEQIFKQLAPNTDVRVI